MRVEDARAGFRRVNEAGLALIRRFEGLFLRPYICPAGWWTIGYGATRGIDGAPVTAAHRAITADEADALLRRDVNVAELGVARLCPVALTDNQYAALASFAFNCGTGALQRSTLRQVVNRGDHAEVRREFMRWTRGGGRELPGLVRRRRAEAGLYVR